MPTIWGRLIHLDSIFRCHYEWAMEVLTRSGSASLWVYGTIPWEEQYMASGLLSEYWTRIQRLTVIVDASLFLGEMDPDTFSYGEGIIQYWEVFQRPAPQLEVFTMQYNESSSSVTSINPKTVCLFNNDAPVLKELAIVGMKYAQSGLWISKLRSLTLTHLFQIPQIFTILSSIRLLESLKIVGTSSKEGIYLDLPILKLPKLTQLSLSGNYWVILPLIDRIIPQAGCSLHLFLETMKRWTFNPADITMLEREHLELIQRKATEYLQRYLLAHPATRLSIDVQDEYVHLSDLSHTVGQDSAFTIDGVFNKDSGPSIIEQISRHEYLSNVNKMSLHLNVTPPHSSCLSGLPSSLRSLSELETSENTLKYLINQESRADGVFPVLRTLKLTHLYPAKSQSRNIWNFLKQQIGGGSPITVLDFTLLPYHLLYDMEYLDSIPGLTMVKWLLPGTGLVQYECGSGKPTNLCFKNTSKTKQQRVDFEEEVDEWYRY
ncbi:hypothetical protein CVT25_004658 [Psilocybe cyanescens]|uniref:Uncharacterized protein n=1 Tax=Psilocybe cyanescens TaxID=93625 RepID=A0A409XMJ0_PSICY|nr:hypothetical protein CVT25_004658 [Psilocybe cyanescens]